MIKSSWLITNIEKKLQTKQEVSQVKYTSNNNTVKRIPNSCNKKFRNI
jgi:hypothetical protein